MNRVTTSQLSTELSYYDVYFSLNSKNIYFHNDHIGEGYNLGYLTLKWSSSMFYISGGFDLDKEERRKWLFSDYDELQDLAEDMVDFVKSYFDSFRVSRKKHLKQGAKTIRVYQQD